MLPACFLKQPASKNKQDACSTEFYWQIHETKKVEHASSLFPQATG